MAWLRTGWLLRRREQAHHAAASLWCLATYVLLMAMLAAAGRIQVFGLFSATASRYNTLALWGWVALGVLALQFGWVRSGPWSARRRFVVATACALITARQAVSVLQAFEPRPDRARAGLALALHVDDLQAIEAVYPDPARAIAIARRSEQQGIGFLARPPYAGLREQLGTRRPGAVLPGCTASIALTEATPTPGTLQRVTGRVWAPVLPDDTQPVAVVDSDVVVGFVTVERGGFATPLVDRTSADLVGYAALSPSSRPMLAWACGHCTGTLETDD